MHMRARVRGSPLVVFVCVCESLSMCVCLSFCVWDMLVLSRLCSCSCRPIIFAETISFIPLVLFLPRSHGQFLDSNLHQSAVVIQHRKPSFGKVHRQIQRNPRKGEVSHWVRSWFHMYRSKMVYWKSKLYTTPPPSRQGRQERNTSNHFVTCGLTVRPTSQHG